MPVAGIAHYHARALCLRWHSCLAACTLNADGMGGKFARKILVTDYEGKVLENGEVRPGDVVSARVYADIYFISRNV